MGKIKDLLMTEMETPVYVKCEECGGDGRYEVDVPMPHNAGRDVGYLDSKWVTCEECHGEGEVEKTCSDCGEYMSAFDGVDETVCFECRHNN